MEAGARGPGVRGATEELPVPDRGGPDGKERSGRAESRYCEGVSRCDSEVADATSGQWGPSLGHVAGRLESAGRICGSRAALKAGQQNGELPARPAQRKPDMRAG